MAVTMSAASIQVSTRTGVFLASRAAYYIEALLKQLIG
jgi:hypothetical protein